MLQNSGHVVFYFCSAKRTIGCCQFGLDPLHETFVVEQMGTGRFAYDRSLLEVFHADAATVLVLFVLALIVFNLL